MTAKDFRGSGWRFPIVPLDDGSLGYVAGDMLLAEPVLDPYDPPPIVEVMIPWIGALLVVGIGTWMASRINARRQRQSANATGGKRS